MSHRDIESDWTSGANGASFGACAVPFGKPTQSFSSEAMAGEMERLSGLPPKELRAAWAKEFRREPSKGLWPDLLLGTLAWRLQEKAFGGHDKATRRTRSLTDLAKLGVQSEANRSPTPQAVIRKKYRVKSEKSDPSGDL
ncbi:MAG TPA: DUF2924 domain-containing protein, partial [Rhizomicrobium sp.]|nr:DUF2924 domain-containing protein [Rhizomicrobium sp.]